MTRFATHAWVVFISLGWVLVPAEKDNKGNDEKSVETTLPAEPNEVTVMELKATDFMHELISNGKLSAHNYVDLTFRLSNATAQAKDALARAKLELQDVLIGQRYKLEDSTKVPAATMQLARVKSGYDQALIAIDRQKLLLYGIDYNEVYRLLKTAFKENEVATLRSYQQYLPISLAGEEQTIDEVLQKTLVQSLPDETGNVRHIPLQALVRITPGEDLKTITAGKNGEYIPF